MKLEGRRALVVGLGKSGLAACRLLAARGARVAAADAKGEASLASALAQLQGLRLEALFAGGIDDAAFADKDLVVVSPGVPLSTGPIERARARGVEVMGEAELAFHFLQEPVLGITGTNGKSTTTALTGHLLATAGLRVFVGGNLGNALCNRALETEARDACVVELSSFQLEGIARFRCAAACVLNVTPDHLDRHPSLEAYAAVKERIFENMREGDAAVLNLADPRVRAMRTPPGAMRRGFDPSPGPDRASPDLTTPAVAFLAGPRQLRVARHEFELRAKTLRGAHNAENALAALLLGLHLGAQHDDLQRGLDTYPGLPHRLEPVRVLDGVEWVNDSKATNVDSVLRSLASFDRGVVLVMGGRGKGAPYAPLRPLFPGRVKALLTIGEDAPRVAAELGDLAELIPCGDLGAACLRAQAVARPGDTVLLSPACASYDQFQNFEERGDAFKRIVGGLS